MAKHKKFLDSQLDNLKKMVSIRIDDYLNPCLEINDSNIVEINIPGVETPSTTLAQQMVATISPLNPEYHNFEAAKLLYEAYENLPLIYAASESFWAYLCHVSLYPFVQKDWSLERRQKGKSPENYILDHYFCKRGLMRNALASLWWGVHLSIDDTKEGEERYHLSKVLFMNYSLRVIWFKVVLRIKPVLHAILEYLEEHKDILTERTEARCRFIANYINRLGSTKSLSALSKDYIKQELEKVHDQIMNAQRSDQISSENEYEEDEED